jgi:hypothetical protein
MTKRRWIRESRTWDFRLLMVDVFFLVLLCYDESDDDNDFSFFCHERGRFLCYMLSTRWTRMMARSFFCDGMKRWSAIAVVALVTINYDPLVLYSIQSHSLSISDLQPSPPSVQPSRASCPRPALPSQPSQVHALALPRQAPVPTTPLFESRKVALPCAPRCHRPPRPCSSELSSPQPDCGSSP